MLKKSHFLLLYLFFTLFLSCTTLHAEMEPLRFGVFSYKSPKTVIKLFMPIAKKLENALNRPVRLSTTANVKLFNQHAIQEDYDLIWTCNSCFAQITKKVNYQAIARGYPSFQGGVIVRKDSNIQDISELKRKKIAAVAKDSYAGYQFFKNEMQKIGLSTPTDYSVKFLSNLDSVIFSVAGRQYDAGVIRLDTLASNRFKKIQKQFLIIATSIDIPQFPFAVKPGTPPNVVKQISTVLTGLNQDSAMGNSILKSLNLKGIEHCTNADFEEFQRELKN
jgi:phosphonate transport system substrate-binding protein